MGSTLYAFSYLLNSLAGPRRKQVTSVLSWTWCRQNSGCQTDSHPSNGSDNHFPGGVGFFFSSPIEIIFHNILPYVLMSGVTGHIIRLFGTKSVQVILFCEKTVCYVENLAKI